MSEKWEVKPEEASVKYIRIRGAIPGKKFKIANAICEHPHELDEARSIARLIAAAPDLLEALDELTLVIGLTPIAGNKETLQLSFDKARAAIAKAKGEK